MLPEYLAKAVPNPESNRAAWYKNTAPSYAGVFLWIAFYNALAAEPITRGTIAVCLLGLIAAGLLCWLLYYLAPGMLGMKTGFPLYIVGSSTFGAKGGYLMPGLLMGLLQVGWFAVATFFASKFILAAAGSSDGPTTIPFIVAGVVWGYVMAWVGVKGIGYVSRVATFLNFIPLAMILLVFFSNRAWVGGHVPSNPNNYAAFTLLIQIVIGFFATAGAAGADFGLSSRNSRDVRLGGLVGIAFAVVIAGGLPLMSVAGANVRLGGLPNLNYDSVIAATGGTLASAMFVLFTIASIPPTCVCAFIASNSFSTMLPSIPRMTSTMAAVTVAIALAVTGAAEDLIGFFTIIGASFGPICGAIAADYLLSGRKWAGPREGINWAGYAAWAAGFVVGILPFLPAMQPCKDVIQPAALYSFVTAFAVYWLAAKCGLQPRTLPMPEARG